MTPPSDPEHSERSTLAACIAHVAGAPAGEVPLDPEEQRGWLSERALGLVPVAGAAAFSWAGPWIARRPARDGSGPRAVVMFGVPSGVIWDPADTADEILDGFVVAPLDVATWPPRPGGEAGVGRVESLVIAPAAEAPVTSVDEAVAVAGQGLQGDRYVAGAGTFASGRPGSALTLVDAAVLDSLGRDVDHRRNVVVRGTDLNALVGREFMLGEVRCRGRRLCEPCAHLDRINGGGVLRPLVHRGGLRADVLLGGTVHVGDRLTPLGTSTAHPPLRHLALAVRDQDRSERFYCTLFGFRPLGRASDGTLMLAGPDGFSLALGTADEPVALPPFLHFGFHASSPAAVEAYRGEVAGRGAEIVGEWAEPDYVSFKCRDPDGYVVEVSWEPEP